MNLPPLDPQTEEAFNRPFMLHTDVLTMFSMLGALQLALRHPKFKKTPTAKHLEKVARDIQKTLTQAMPKQAFLMEAGWHQKFDPR